MVLMVIATPLLSMTVFPAPAAATGWLGEQWEYRREITISGNGSDLTDIQYQLTGIDTQTLYNEGKLQFDCQDVRFTNAYGALLHFWIEDDSSSCGVDTSTDFWIRLPRAEAEGTTIFMYYGNPQAPAYLSPERTFDFFSQFSSFRVPWYNSAWQNRLKISINREKVRGTIPNFPVALDLSILGSAFWQNVDPQGDDLVITAADGTTKLARELVTINTGTETGTLWFKAPVVTNEEDTDFYLYYGNPAATETDDTATWSGHGLVQHLEESPTGSAPQITDSSGSNNNGTTSGFVSGDLVDTVIDSGLNFDGNDNEVNSGIPFASVTNNFSYSFWAYPESTRTETVQANSGITGTSGQRFVVYPEHGGVAFGSNARAGAGVSFGTNGISVFEHSGSYLPSLLVHNHPYTGWTHVVVVYSAGTPVLYVNGKFVKTGLASTKTVHPGASLAIGAFGKFDGLVDEFRVINSAVTPNWISTEYENHSSPETFFLLSVNRFLRLMIHQFSRIRPILQVQILSGCTTAPRIRLMERLYCKTYRELTGSDLKKHSR
ncbi:MAG: hypothetical protein TR69_WS6001001289 [candidate division WS6 bacterium OLB20]|uniref:DUF2341 domain-containing protein n=1 Tax=candidate division WS6 bacterium OLB20 TaxID=1617426 RepID=A0A136LWL1_9BACT|nr:MAG: hypothetical protein TR69_WS6001001289 [candidate division WS6 bacterium OLB20]